MAPCVSESPTRCTGLPFAKTFPEPPEATAPLGADADYLVRCRALVEALRARFLYSQSFSQTDPWAQRAEGAEAEHHAPMARFTPQEKFLKEEMGA